MVYSGFIKFISMVYPFPLHVVRKVFWVGGGCALFSPIGFRGMSHFQAKKGGGDGTGLERTHE